MKRNIRFVIAGGAIACVIIAGVVSVMSSVRRNQCDCELTEAIGSENYTAVARLLQQGASPNADVYRFAADADCSGQAWILALETPKPMRCPVLTYTLWPQKVHGDLGNTQMARLLLKAGANPNLADEQGNTPLIVASHFGNVEAVQLLLEHGANRAVTDSNGLTAIDMARKNGHSAVVVVLSKTTP